MEYRDFDTREIATIVSFAITFNCEEARRMFLEKFGKDPPPARTLRDWKTRFLDTLSVIPRNDSIKNRMTHSCEDASCMSNQKVNTSNNCFNFLFLSMLI